MADGKTFLIKQQYIAVLVSFTHHINKGVRKVSPLAAGGGTSNRESLIKPWLQE